MPIVVTCPDCDSRFRVQSSLSGKRIRCPRCHKGVITVPPKDADRPAATTDSDAAPAPASASSRRTRPAERRMDRAIPCPQCDASIPAGSEICPKCGYHTKLGRRLSLGAAIDEAMRSPETGGEGRITSREEKAARRVAQGWWVQLGMRLAVALLCLGVVGFGLLLVNRTLYGSPLDVLAQEVPPPGPQPESLHPYHVGAVLDLEIHLPEVRIERSEALAEGTEAERLVRFARSVRLPVAPGGLYYGGTARRILERVATLGGTYSAETIAEGDVRGRPVSIWRQTWEPGEAGFLYGALLDFGEEMTGFVEARERRKGEGRLRIEATLSVLPTPAAAYREAPFSYDEAVTNEMPWIRQPPSETSPPEVESYDTVADRNAERYHLHPVLIVHEWEILDP